MTESQTEAGMPPPCPHCAHLMSLKEVHRNAPGKGFTCFFRCDRCELHYPRLVSEEDGLAYIASESALTPEKRGPGTH